MATRRLEITIEIAGDVNAARDAINRALDAGTIQDAIVACTDDDAEPDGTWDIEQIEVTS